MTSKRVMQKNNSSARSPLHDVRSSSSPIPDVPPQKRNTQLSDIFAKAEMKMIEALWDDTPEIQKDKFEELEENLYDYRMNLSDKIRSFIIKDLGKSEDKANILVPQWEIALNNLESAKAPLAEPKTVLPDRAPEIYANRQVRPELGRKENPIEFLQRVWGDFMAQGIVYQSDIKRLGDPKLVQAVRGRCFDTDLDPASVLPPPGFAKRPTPTDLGLTTDEAEAVYLEVARAKMRAKRNPMNVKN